jgi:phage repressor protein C with HTH and peptisase S24 domain
MEATPMKLVGAISTAVLALTLGAAVPAHSQEAQRDPQDDQKAKPAQQDEKKTQPDKSAKQEEKTPRQDKDAKQEQKAASEQNKDAKQEDKTSQERDKNSKQEEKTTQQQQRPTEQAKPEQQAGRTGNKGAGRIPDDRYKANFGQQHTFRVTQADYSSHRFQYGGYSFGFVDQWPSNWLYTQNVFVVDIDGVYYLCNPMYPGVNIALTVTL